jgi:ribosomal protein S7
MKNLKTTEIIEDIVVQRYTNMMSTLNLVAYIKKEYGFKQSRAYELVREARMEVAEYHRKTNENVLEDAINKMETMFQDAIEANNNKLAIDIQKELNKVQQLYQDTLKLDLGGDTAIEINIIKPD